MRNIPIQTAIPDLLPYSPSGLHIEECRVPKPTPLHPLMTSPLRQGNYLFEQASHLSNSLVTFREHGQVDGKKAE